MKVLVTGGAGYIGSHAVVALIENGWEPTIVDSFVNARADAPDRIADIVGRAVPYHRFDLRDRDTLFDLFSAQQFDAVIHLAGLKVAAESVSNPLRYYEHNLEAAFSVLNAMRAYGTEMLIFSSSAAVYSAESPMPLIECSPTGSSNPYGWSKWMIEQVLRDLTIAWPQLRVAVLRYFNPVGAHKSRLIGEAPSQRPSTLVPRIADAADGVGPPLRVFGTDYPTPDGTCIRDYIHVEDLVAGHLAALRALPDRPGLSTWNLGTGTGTSVLEMIAAYERVGGKPVPYVLAGRRPGDQPVSIADPSLANTELGWRAWRGVDEMCADVVRWRAFPTASPLRPTADGPYLNGAPPERRKRHRATGRSRRMARGVSATRPIDWTPAVSPVVARFDGETAALFDD